MASDPKCQLLAELVRSVAESAPRSAKELTEKALDAGISPLEVLEKGLSVGIQQVGAQFARGEVFLPELVMGAAAMQAGVDVLKVRWENMATERKVLGRVMLGTVKGDIHSIGKQIVSSLLAAAGFDVIDLGVSIPLETFVEKVREIKPDVLGLSALLTTSVPQQRYVVQALEKAGIRGSVRVLVGGAPTTEQWAAEIGADGWAPNAATAVEEARRVLGLATAAEVRS